MARAGWGRGIGGGRGNSLAPPIYQLTKAAGCATLKLHLMNAKTAVVAAALSLAVWGGAESNGAEAVAASRRTAALPPEMSLRPRGNFSNNVARPLRYWPVGTDFVITNGAEYFNRPLYGLNSAFRIDGGDQPEFSLYLPGRGGNLRLGIKTSAGVKWLNQAEQIITRYRPGSLRYAIRDPLLGDGELDLTALPLSETKGFILRAELAGANNPVELIFAFGGANGMKGQRNGDIGCERQPVSQLFQLQPEQCKGNEFSINANVFWLKSKSVQIAGCASAATMFIADAGKWNDIEALLKPGGKEAELPVVVGRADLQPNAPFFFALESDSTNVSTEIPIWTGKMLPKLFSDAENHRRKIAEQVVVETPDPFINAAAPALCIAADAVWDEPQQAFMHGAVAWRTRLLGWRGQYAGDDLGWHERTAAHFAGFASNQNTNPIPAAIPPPDEAFNLARSEAAIHANGDLSKNHYDMNLVAVDAFFRHLRWTGDTNYARQMWPVIERHLAWDRRLFRREFGPDQLPLYEAYAAIWASDDLNYNGGGTAHASAYNYFANQEAARVAKMLGADPAIYEREAALILRGMNKYLWLAGEGNFAESKDWLGLQLAHPNSGLWTFYHTVDSAVPTPLQAWRMSRWIDLNIAHIPICGANVPEENLFTLPETSWMPYQWSLNNVVMAESAHTALGFWQANRPETAFQLFKGELLDSMFLGLCPGNFGCMTSHDMARGEAQRDFGDAIGINSRALVEGLFGVRPDALAGEVKIVPGFPAKWDHAAIRHPDFNLAFHREGLQETYVLEQKFSKPLAVHMELAALRDGIARVTVNGRELKAAWVQAEPGCPRLEVETGPAVRTEIVIVWQGDVPKANLPADSLAATEPAVTPAAKASDWNHNIASEKLEMISLAPFFNDQVTQIFRNEYRSPRSPFASLAVPKQGIGGWCEPNASFDVDDSGLRALAKENGDRIILPDGIPLATPGEAGAKNIIFTSQWDNYPRDVSVPLAGKSSHAFLLLAGSTGAMQSQLDNGEIIVTYADGSAQKLPLRNPTNWWPIDQDYFIDDFAFRRPEPIPPRVDLRSGQVRLLDAASFKGRGGRVPGGAATVLELPLDGSKELKSLTLRALANEVVIGLMSVTLAR